MSVPLGIELKEIFFRKSVILLELFRNSSRSLKEGVEERRICCRHFEFCVKDVRDPKDRGRALAPKGSLRQGSAERPTAVRNGKRKATSTRNAKRKTQRQR